MLLAITPGDGRDLVPWLEALCDAGLEALLVREPTLDARGLARVLDAARVPELVVHDRHPHARRLATERGLAVHLTAALHDPPARFTASTHTAAELDHAFEAGARWCLLSPVFATSKPGDDRSPLGVSGFVRLAAGRPVLALGGVTPARHGELTSAGAFGSGVLGGLFGAADPAEAAAQLRLYLEHRRAA
jgi:thiamine monophosphate synthase